MITSYSISKDTLYFYFDFSYEFAGDNTEESILNKILKYIKDKQIRFNGTKIVLVASGIIIGNILFNMEDITFNYDGIMTKMILENTAEVENIKEINKETNNTFAIEKKSNSQTSTIIEKIETPEVANEPEKKATEPIKEEVIKNVEQSKQETFEPIKETIEETQPITKIPEQPTYINPVTIHRSNGQIITLELEEYLIGVVGAEMPASFNIEALKAQAIAARTYTLKRIKEGKNLTDTESTQSYNDNNQLQNKWGNDYTKYYNKIKGAIDSTKGMYITYNGNYIDAVYHASNNGYTVSASTLWGYDIPYLRGVESSFDINTTSYLRTITKTIVEVEAILKTKIDDFTITKDNTNHVTTVLVGDKTYTGIEFRNLLNLRSTDFDIEIKDTNLLITTRGYGHGVGMSQYGANAMANSGYSYIQILNHYYTNIKILP